MSILCPLDGKECWSSGCFFQHGQNKICTKQNFTIATDRTVMTEPIDQAMTRKEKVAEFFMVTKFPPRWCMASVCACMGCVNNYPKKKEWYAMFPDEPYLTKEDVDIFKLQ